MRARYIGPLIVISHNRGGAYIICELDGSVFDQPVATFRIIPYLARRSLTLPSLQGFIDVLPEHLVDMEAEEDGDPQDIIDSDDNSKNDQMSVTSDEED